MKKKTKRNYHAKLTIHGMPDMDEETRKRLFNWLKSLYQSTENPSEYGQVYTARLMK